MLLSRKSICLLFVYILSALTFSLYAQTSNTDWGEVTEKMMTMTEYPKDPGASAVVLFDIGKTQVNRDMEVVYERHVRIKILSEEGYDHATVSIPYLDKKNRQEVKKIDGLTFVYDEQKNKVKKHKLGKRDVFEEEINDDWKRLKFTLPALTPGAIVEYRYEFHSESPLDVPNWFFQWSIPVIWSEYNMKVPEWFTYLHYFRGYHKFFISSQDTYIDRVPIYSRRNSYTGSTRSRVVDYMPYNGTEYRWVMRNLPAMKEEPYMTTLNDYKAQLRFQLSYVHFPNDGVRPYLTNWSKLAKDLRNADGFGKELKSNKDTRRTVESVIDPNKDMEDLEKVKAIYNYLVNSVEWNGDLGVIAERSVKDVLSSNNGSSVEINLTLVQLLRDAGLNADPVLLSTRGHGKIIDIYPLVEQFNDVIAHVKLEDRSLLLDATDADRPYNLLPPSCLNGKGFLVEEESSRWVPLFSAANTSRSMSVIMEVEENGSITGKLTSKSQGYLALEDREQFEKASDEDPVEEDSENSQDIRIDSVSVVNLDNIEEYLGMNAYFEMEDDTTFKEVIYIEPLVMFGESENPFKLEERNFPVDFSYPFNKTYRASITLPEGYQLDQPPRPKIIKLPNDGGLFRQMVQQVGPTVSFLSEIRISRMQFTPEEYRHLKLFFDEIVKSHDQPLVVKKINTGEE